MLPRPRAARPRRALLALALAPALALTAPARAESPRQAGEALRDALASAPPRAELGGTRRLAVVLGEARVGSLVLRTDLVEREGTPIYRLVDRLSVDLPGLGTLHMLVQADLRADLSALRVVLETEEPRGAGAVSRQRVELAREEGAWVRTVVKGRAAPVREVLSDLPEDVLVLTPPLGAGERLALLAGARLGDRFNVRALDLETGDGASWRLSVEDRREVASDEGPLTAAVAVRREGAALLRAWVDPATAAPWRVEAGGRLAFRGPELPAPATDAPPAVAAVIRFLRAAARDDRATLRELLDTEALYAAAGAPAADAAFRATFEDALLRRLTDPAWLERSGFLLGAWGCTPDDFTQAPGEDGRVRVQAKGAEGEGAFIVDAAGRLVDLPRPR